MNDMQKQISPYISDMDQIAWAREAELTSGAGRGNRIIDVDNGSGLRFTVSPDRGMDIVEASFNGVPMVFRTPGGNRSRMEYDPAGIGWLRTWQGGLMTTCGLRTTGTPDGEFGLHGRIDNLGAEDVSIHRGWNKDEYHIQLRGVVREAMMFGENLRLERTITTAFGKNIILVNDRVTNLGPDPDYVQIVYHCNFGYPFISPEAQVVLPEHKIIPRDANAEKDLANWKTMPPPATDFPPEECFFHELPAVNEAGDAVFTVENPAIGIRASVIYNTKTLPRIVQWKLFQQNRYVMGIEPTNTKLNGRKAEIANGDAVPLAPGESMNFRVQFLFETFSKKAEK